ncbi:MAG: GAF domain-containing sensor histidine kinase [Anaerolineae bacterium]|nr:GAF domain-containing sensor histidine kinase [Anaerolineae bacterium]
MIAMDGELRRDTPTDPGEMLMIYQKFIDIFKDLASTFDLDTILRKIIHTAKDLTSAEAASILLYDEPNQGLHFAAMTNASKEALLHTMVVPKESLAGWVATNRESVIVEDVHQDKRWFTNVSKKIDFPTRNIIAVPMITQNTLIGVLEVLNKSSGTFDLQDQGFLELLGSQAAVAINNTRLFQQSDLISELVHELRTPLGSMSTVAYLLQRPGLSDDQRLSLAQTIQQETERLNQMASDYLDFARLESGRIFFRATTFNLADLLAECIEIVRSKIDHENQTLMIDIEPQLSSIEADREKIKQVILNFLSNAIKYNSRHGRIEVKAHNLGKNQVQVSFTDTGIGMSPDDLQHLFERFFRSSNAVAVADGTGLGLSICKQIIEAHGGSIRVNSEVNLGSTFTMLLPTTLS